MSIYGGIFTVKNKQKNLNVPNVLTCFRIALLPVYWWLFEFSHPTDGYYNFHLIALLIFVVASLTDIADGYIARKYNLITDFGKLADPLADKLMVISVMLSLALYIRNTLFTVALGLILLKETAMVVGGLIMLKKKIVVFSKWIGKAAQATVVTALITSFFSDYFDAVGFPLHLILICVGVCLTFSAGIYYMIKAIGGYNA